MVSHEHTRLLLSDGYAPPSRDQNPILKSRVCVCFLSLAPSSSSNKQPTNSIEQERERTLANSCYNCDSTHTNFQMPTDREQIADIHVTDRPRRSQPLSKKRRRRKSVVHRLSNTRFRPTVDRRCCRLLYPIHNIDHTTTDRRIAANENDSSLQVSTTFATPHIPKKNPHSEEAKLAEGIWERCFIPQVPVLCTHCSIRCTH